MRKRIIAFALPALLMSTSIAQDTATVETVTGYTTPLHAVFADNSFPDNQELSTITLSQTLNRVESPDAVMITLTESGLMDDSISAIRTTYIVKQSIKDDAPVWTIDEKFTAQKCRRSEEPDAFTSDPCL